MAWQQPVWCIVFQVFSHIFTVFSLPREQFIFSPAAFNNPQRKLLTNTFKSEQTQYSPHPDHTNNPTFRLDLPGWTENAEVLPTRNVESDITDHITGYTAPTFNYVLSQSDSREIIDSSEEQEMDSNKRRRNKQPATSSVYFRLGNSPVTQYKVVHIPPLRQRGNVESNKMITLEKAKFIGMSRNPPDFNPFTTKQSAGSFPQYQDKNQKPDIHVNNSETLHAQYLGKAIKPPDFNPLIAKTFVNNVSQYQDKHQNPHISDNRGENIQTQYTIKDVNHPVFPPITLKPTVLVPINIPLSNSNFKGLITNADKNKKDLLLVNSNAEITETSFLNPHLIQYQQLNTKSPVTPKSNIKSTFPSLFIQNVTPKILLQPQNLTFISDLTLKNPQNFPPHFQGTLTNHQQPQVQFMDPNVQNILVHKNIFSSVIQHPRIQQILTQRKLDSFTNTKSIVENSSVQINLKPSTVTQTNFQHIPPIQKGKLMSTFTLSNIDNSSSQKNLMSSSITHLNIPRITTYRSILTPTIAQSSVENSSVHKASKDLNENSYIFDSEGTRLREEDSQSHKSEKPSISGSNFKFEPPGPRTDDTYFYSYDINSTKQPQQFSGRNFGQAEKREKGRTTGRYYVQLPDGRVQVVTYYADHTGYHPTVSYFGAKKNI